MQIHELKGCAPTPLAHYLKALGILRLVAEQKDPEARGWWEGDRFFLATHLNESELLRFFLEEYAPTPMVAPWNKGSGFFNNDSVFNPIENSTASRFSYCREGIAASRSLLSELSIADQDVRNIKAETKQKDMSKAQKDSLKQSEDYKQRLAAAEKRFKTLKAEFIPQLRCSWRGRHLEWLDAAMVMNGEGEAQFPSLLGTGGNDGRLDFANNYFQNLNEVFCLKDTAGKPRQEASDWFSNALWGSLVNSYRPGAIGQYAPGAIGGANSTVGPDGDSLLNPVDLLLLLEGAILFTAHATRRLSSRESIRAAAPFVVNSSGSGYASAGTNDESARGEQWMPLWSQPVTIQELKHLFAEGRSRIGIKPVHESLEMARAVANLGTARGIFAFQRYGYIERNGQSNLAVPLGRFRVPDRVYPLLSCLDDLDRWLVQLRSAVHDRNAPFRLQMAERSLSNHLFSVTQHPDEPARWQSVVLALADVEAILLSSPKYRTGPIPKLKPEWALAGDDGSPEWRLALVFAMQAESFGKDGRPKNPIRRHLVPEKNGEVAAVMKGRRGTDDAIALVQRRLIEAAQKGKRQLPLQAAKCVEVKMDDLALLISGRVDLDRTLAFARTLMALDGYAWARNPQKLAPSAERRWPDDAWMAIRLAMIPWPLKDGRTIPNDPAILRRLESGDGATAIDLAMRRLHAAGIRTTIRAGSVSTETARLWAAALAFPIGLNLAEHFVRRLDPYYKPLTNS